MKNQAASVKQRLLNFNRSQAQPEEFQKLLGVTLWSGCCIA
ncbi:MAG: hypothetical protein ACRCZS_01380 [Chroococcidiopsis sp.]